VGPGVTQARETAHIGDAVLLLYRPPQTYMHYSLPRNRMRQAHYNQQMQSRYNESLARAPASRTSALHTETLVRVLHAAVAGDERMLRAACTRDVRVWTPAIGTASVDELIDALRHRQHAFSDLELGTRALDVTGDRACVEWSLAMTHTGALSLRDGVTTDPTGLRITVHGTTVADFRAGRVAALRQYWDELALWEQLGLLDDSR
jgi:ketosteroid isomerase-like protein